VWACSRIANDSTKLYILTNENAPQYKVITIDLADPKRERKDLIPEQGDAFLDDVVAVGKDRFAIVYKRNVGSLSIRRLPEYGINDGQHTHRS